MSQVQTGRSSGALRPGCPWRGFLSAAGLSLIYGGHNWAAGRTGEAPSLSQPQVMANYNFISSWPGRTRADLQPQPETRHGSKSFYLAMVGEEIPWRVDKCAGNVFDAVQSMAKRVKILKLLQIINYITSHRFWTQTTWFLETILKCVLKSL